MKQRGLDNSQTTAERLQQEQTMRKAELEKIENLDQKISIELNTLQERRTTMTEELKKFGNIPQLREEAETVCVWGSNVCVCVCVFSAHAISQLRIGYPEHIPPPPPSSTPHAEKKQLNNDHNKIRSSTCCIAKKGGRGIQWGGGGGICSG